MLVAREEEGPLPGTLPPYKDRIWTNTCEMVTKAGKDEEERDRGSGGPNP